MIAPSTYQSAAAADDGIEREQLAALVRQLDLIDRLAEHAAHTAPQERARYHFDHARLREDLQRVRAGIQDYLTPPRAQPRDPVELSGDYRQSSPPSDEGAPQ
ncbi:RAQPRD family integrative conjugative element protein [Stenotrophomonas maltophilia]|uniref:integrative conjugative element protein, RAQPRD family n=1 Tax=Stenotrophomonas maltophilia TaxID=40324 RepID=UPI003CCFEFCE